MTASRSLKRQRCWRNTLKSHVMPARLCTLSLVALAALQGCGGGTKEDSVATSAAAAASVPASQTTGSTANALKVGLPVPPMAAASYPALTVTAPNTVLPDYAAASIQNQVQHTSTTTLTVNNLTGSFAAGDTVMVIQTQDPRVNGLYEFATVQSTPVVTGGTANLLIATSAHTRLGNLYDVYGEVTEDFTNNAGGGYFVYKAARAQVVKLPIYSVVNINSGNLTAPAWNPRTGTGGILALYSAGAINVADGASINMNAKGFLGGARQTPLPWPRSGESVAGMGYVGCPPTGNAPSCDMSAIGLGSIPRSGLAAIGSGFYFGGAFSFHGGGGGSYGRDGAGGGLLSANVIFDPATNQPGQFAANPGGIDSSGDRILWLDEILFGSGGGSTFYAGAAGGNGGGLVMLFATTDINLSGTSFIESNGGAGESISNGLGAGDVSGGIDEGGGGSGGSIYLSGDKINGGAVHTYPGPTLRNGGHGGPGVIRLDTSPSQGTFDYNMYPSPARFAR